MDDDHELWAAIRRVLPDAETLTAGVAAELGEPAEDVRASVLIGTIAMNGQLGPEAAAVEAIEVELGRLRPPGEPRSRGRLAKVATLGDLLAETQALESAGTLDLATIVAIQRASGAIAARTDRRMVELLHRYAVTRRLIWEHCVAASKAGTLEPGQLAAFGRFLLLWNELTSLAVTDGYRAAERELLARAVEARRGALQELLGLVTSDAATAARVRRAGVRHGLDPDRAVLPRSPSRRTRRAIRSPSGPGSARRSSRSSPGGSAICSARPHRAPRAWAPGSGCRPSCRSWAASRSSRSTTGPASTGCRRCIDSVLGGLAAAARARAAKDRGPSAAAPQPAWVAVCARGVDGIGSLAVTYGDLVDATRTAQRLGRRGWIADPGALALERLLLADPRLAEAIVRRELGPLLDDERFGEELIETLQAYFDSGRT